MKKLEISQMENLQGGKYCTKQAASIFLAYGGLVAAALTGGIGGLIVAGAGYYLALDSAGEGCSSW